MLLRRKSKNLVISLSRLNCFDHSRIKKDLSFIAINILPLLHSSNLCYTRAIEIFDQNSQDVQRWDYENKRNDAETPKTLKIEHNEWLLDQVVNGRASKWFEVFTIRLAVNDRTYHVPTKNDLEKFGTMLAENLMKEYEMFMRPWLVMDKQIMQRVGIRCFEIELVAFERYFRHLVPNSHELEQLWFEEIVPRIEEYIRMHCHDPRCVIDVYPDSIVARHSFKISLSLKNCQEECKTFSD